jgi:hypothetical protein
MRNLLNSGLELLVRSGVLYVPLLFDPDIEREVRGRPATGSLAEENGRLFVRALTLKSLLDNYGTIDPESYVELKYRCLKDCPPAVGMGKTAVEGKLREILFGMTPHFVRKSKGPARRTLGEEGILDLIGEKIRIPPRYHEEAERLADAESVSRRLRWLEDRGTTACPPREGPVSPGDLFEWIQKALASRIVEEEKDRLRRMLQSRDRLTGSSGRRSALLLYIAEEGSLDIGGFGFSRMGGADDYLVYKHTGEFALKDFYGRLYLFPDCRVAVTTVPPLKPFVIETYKHPFLEGYEPGQIICMHGFEPPRVFSAASAIHALEEGIGALLYGYSSRRHKGYHALDRTASPVRVEESEDDGVPWHHDDPLIRSWTMRDIDFQEYRIPNDHRKIAEGQVEVTNQLTP